MPSETSREAYEQFRRTHADEHAKCTCFASALEILDSRPNDPRVTEPEIAFRLHDTSRSIARRLPELAALGYFVPAGEKQSQFLTLADVGPVANAWTTPQLQDRVPAEFRGVAHRKTTPVLSPKQQLKNLLEAVVNLYEFRRSIIADSSQASERLHLLWRAMDEARRKD